MKIYCYGATGDVTGSAYDVKTKHGSVPVDCGLYQGGKPHYVAANNRETPGLHGG